MSKLGLKEAMNLLQVNKPLKLAARAPSFTPPIAISPVQTPVENLTQVENKTEAQLQTQIQNVTQVEYSTLVVNPTSVANVAPVELETPELNVSQVTEATPVQIQTQGSIQTVVENNTQVINETPVSKTTEVVRPSETHTASQPEQRPAIKRATEQDSSVVLEARASEGLEKGYTRLPNSILMKMANGDLTRGEIKILLLIARFTISFQRKLAPLSKTVLERQSGLRGAGVLEALAGLVTKKLIIKEQGDQHRPNMLGLVLPSDWDQLIGTSVEKQTQVVPSTSASKATPDMKASSGEVVKQTLAQVENPSPFKDIKIYSNKNSHSQLPEVLQKYFSELKPMKKRESEFKSFQELCVDYSQEDIAECFLVIRKRGIGNDSEPCHSPMAFLGQAMAGVLGEVEEQRKKVSERLAREQREIEAKQKHAESEASLAAEWEMKEKAFFEAFPEESKRTEILTKMCQDFPFKLSGEAARVMGIGKWWEDINK